MTIFTKKALLFLGSGASIPPNPIMHIAYPHISQQIINFRRISSKFIHFPLFLQNLNFCLIEVLLLPHPFFTRTGRPCLGSPTLGSLLNSLQSYTVTVRIAFQM